MTVFVVTSAGDSGAGSLREAVQLANAHAGADTITFAASFNGEAADLIRLTSGQITITDALTITGGPQGVRITGDRDGDDVLDRDGYTDVAASLAAGADILSDNSRVFLVTGASSATTLENLQITGGRTETSNPFGFVPNINGGGAIRSEATLTLRNTEVAGNSTSGYRAAGGGVAATNLVMEGSTLAGNVTTGDLASGGGFSVSGSASLTNSTVAANWVSGGGASSGAGLASSLTLLHATVTGNANYTRSYYGDGTVLEGGIRAYSGSITNSIVSGNATRAGLLGAETRGIAGLGIVAATDVYTFSSLATTGSLVGGDPAAIFGATVLLPRTVTWYSAGLQGGALDKQGGLVRTVGIAPGSAAQDIGVPTALATDQLGNPRTVGAAPDAGAREIRDAPSLVVTTARDVVDGADGVTSLREAVAYANARAGADRITFDQSVFNGEAADVIRLVHGQIDITDELTIDGGPGRPVITGDAAGNDVLTAAGLTDAEASQDADVLGDNSRLVFVAESAGRAELANLTLTGGSTSTRFTDTNAYSGRVTPPLSLDRSGPAVWTLSDLTLTGVTVSGNAAPTDVADNASLPRGVITGGDSARASVLEPFTIKHADLTITGSVIERNFLFDETSAVATFGNVTMADSIVRDNRATGVAAEGGTLQVTGSLIAGNRSGGLIGRDVTVTGSSILNNGTPTTPGPGPYGGPAIYGGETILLVNSTVAGNVTSPFRATLQTGQITMEVPDPFGPPGSVRSIWVTGGSVTLLGSTVTGNLGMGYGGYGSGGILSGTVTLTDSIVVANRDRGSPFGGSIDATFATINNNSIVGVDGSGIFAVTDSRTGLNAGVAADNGGPVPTVALLPWVWNPAIDTAGAGVPATDQRGAPRQDVLPGGGVADRGAFEVQSLDTDGIEARSLVVTTAADVLDARDGRTSLREAILYANAHPGHDTVTFDAAVFDGEAADLIRLTRGALFIDESLTIQGGPAAVRISGDALGNDVLDADGFTAVRESFAAGALDDNSRVLMIAGTAEAVHLERLQITGGAAASSSLVRSQQGGGIFSNAALLTVTDSEVSGNAAITTSGYYGYGQGGGIWSGGNVVLTRTTIAGNVASRVGVGSGVFAGGAGTVTDSTFAFNTGASALIASSVAITGSTFTGNTSPVETSSGLTLTNSIVAGNERPGALAPDSATSIVTADGRPLFAATVEVAPGVFAGVLADNGGPARTVALNADPSNPALDAADAGASATDQRGTVRADLLPGGGVADLGAFELPSLQADMVLRGDAAANRLIGGAGKDLLRGAGGADDLIGLGGKDTLVGGTGADSMAGGAGDDVYWVDDAGDRVTEVAGGGQDRVIASVSHTLAAWVETLVLTGTAALNGTGNALDNRLIGNSGANQLSGGLGVDRLTGGAGADAFVFGSAAEGGDRITDFVHGEDRIWLSAAGFGGLLAEGPLDAGLLRIGAAATGTGAQLVYNPANGRLSWDADGGGPGTATLLAVLLNKPAGFDASDIVVVA